MENSTSSRPGCPVIQFFSSLNERLGGGAENARLVRTLKVRARYS